MPNIKNRITKLEAYRMGEAGLRNLSDRELEDLIRELGAKWKGCKPEEVDVSPEGIDAMIAGLKAKIERKEEDRAELL